MIAFTVRNRSYNDVNAKDCNKISFCRELFHILSLIVLHLHDTIIVILSKY